MFSMRPLAVFYTHFFVTFVFIVIFCRFGRTGLAFLNPSVILVTPKATLLGTAGNQMLALPVLARYYHLSGMKLSIL